MAFKISSFSTMASTADRIGEIKSEFEIEMNKISDNVAALLKEVESVSTEQLAGFSVDVGEYKDKSLKLFNDIIEFINVQNKNYSTAEQELVNFIGLAQQDLEAMEVI